MVIRDKRWLGKNGNQTMAGESFGGDPSGIFGSNRQFRSREVYAGGDGHSRFVQDFVKVLDKIMMLDRFDVRD